MSLYSNEQEIPVTCTPIFEGHLYVRTEKKEWKWRLFRFDGSTFTCLSTKKQPNSPTVNNPLYTTPKRLTDESIPNIKYFQLPEWTVDLSTICSISLLRKSKRPPKCFSIQTIFNKRYVLKASKQKDLERWLFVLTKMWTFTQQQRQQEEPKVQPMLKPMLSREKVQVIEEWRRSLAELMAQDPNIKKTVAPPPIEPMPEDDNLSIFTDMTSISHRRPNKKVIKRPSTRRAKIMPKEMPLVTEANLILKKKGLDDAGLWMSNNLFNYFQQEKSEDLSSFDNNNNAVFVEKVKYYNLESGKKLIIQSQSNYLNYAKREEEEDEDISLAELLHKLNLTKQPSVKKCSSFVAPAIPPYKVSNYH
ncbi:uncharacterized protein RHIMIDRAFT_269748 [Rhizopus microsporus ATCC 52813]|uniref:PH domain-containing protein n=1 Tax=Rhizopus microsporus ATCC 52813 TaxID=1340429 RepID=A0A2G4SHR2_RHIZD|nr:uncharacterized protein RHIMIDRAFT_269748 [Rhizopus microsporus ATCC 52813]PHZ08305.1 hypothetical protein RHIMIDRAFT_269748 [Rhizopus microsporus ATCC 52813]